MPVTTVTPGRSLAELEPLSHQAAMFAIGLLAVSVVAISMHASNAADDVACRPPAAEYDHVNAALEKVQKDECSAIPEAIEAFKAYHAAIERLRTACPDANQAHPDGPRLAPDYARWERLWRADCEKREKKRIIQEQDALGLGRQRQ